MVDFISIIDASIEWTKAVLFKPFNLKKWLILCLIAFLAGTLSGGFHSNFGNKSPSKSRQSNTSQTQSLQQETKFQSTPDLHAIKNKILNNPRIIALIISGVLLVCCIVIFFIWLNARFSFIFIEALTKNDASIKIPFRSSKQIGNSLFVAYLPISAVFLSLFGSLVFFIIKDIMRLTVYNKGYAVGFKKIFLTCLPYGFSIVVLFIISIILYLIISDFVQIVMFKDRIKFMPAFLKAISVINRNKSNFITYIFVKMGLGIGCGMIFMLLYMICLLVLIIPGAIIAFLFYLLYHILPHLAFFIILAIVLVPTLLVISCFFLCLGLPFAVFFRTLSMKFIARLEPHYNLFRHADWEAIS